MAKVKLALAELTIEEKTTLATDVVAAMTGNAAFATPNPALANITAIAAALGAAAAKAAEARRLSQIATLEQDAAEDDLDKALSLLASYVENASAGDEAKILSSGMAVRADSAPAGLPGTPGPVAATTGDGSGEVDLSWPRLGSAKSFVIQYAASPDAPDADWKFGGTSTKSTCTVGGLAAGTRHWFRVAAVASAGQSPWSSPVTARAI